MAKVGLSKPFYAKYAAANQVVTYSGGASMGKAVEAQIEPDDNDIEKFYADNGPAESAQVFSGGTLTLNIDRLDSSVVGDIYGITPGSSATPVGTTLAFKADAVVPYVGIGLIAKNIVDNSAVWIAMVLPKVQFVHPTFDLTTQGETIEFSGNELTATILRDDTSDGNWLKMGYFSSEADAETWIKSLLSISAATT
jgi:phi13 family phage major tail protein